MPKAFDDCQKAGGRIRTIKGPNANFKVPDGYYRHVCWLKGEPNWGHLKKKQSEDKAKK